MPKKHDIYWYNEEPSVKKAFLYNCRDGDLRFGNGIPYGSIVQGIGGFVCAENEVPNLSASIISTFRANRDCDWMGFTLRCMVHPEAPLAPATKKELRPYNYVVASLTEVDSLAKAKTLGMSIISLSDGMHLINLEISAFEKQGISCSRRAKLL